MGFIDADQCHRLGEELGKSGYGEYVMAVARAALADGTAVGAPAGITAGITADPRGIRRVA
jgi:glucose-1-phosphate thymidylyltransferase